MRLILASFALIASSAQLPGQQPSPEALAFYQSSVQPVLRANCLPCHNEKNRTSGLAFDNREAILAGGNRGPLVKPDAPGESLLLAAVEQQGDLKMPPGRRLKEDEIASLRRWIEQGAVFPLSDAPAKRPGQDHWAFQPPKRPSVPAVRDAAWVRNPIDNFILARLERENVKPSPEAARRALLRRLSFDLTGLPPSPREIDSFLADSSPGAYEKAVDRLLASPHYGERWGRHWLDLARYADSDGYTIDAPRQIWKYRDWVIQALNRDMPFDEFVIEQIAGDLLPNPSTDQLIATGFQRNTPNNYEGGIDFEQYRVENVADRVATTGAAFLGLTLACARCHDHKYDPISQREFYQLFAYYNNTDEISSEDERYDYLRPVLELATPEESARRDAHRAQRALLARELAAYVKALSAKPAAPGDPPKHEDPGLRERMANLRALERRAPHITTTLVMRELPEPRDSYIHLGGDFLRRGAPVTPGVPAVLSAKPVGGTRLDLAKWLVSPENPLTARVTVNRMWQAYFGKGLVETENDFGLLGAKPTHPELLDWLAAEFVQSGWRQKALHRLIVTSAAYRQSSKNRPELDEIDPYNRLLARQSRMRLEAEIIRDAALTASGLLNPSVGGPSVYPPIPDGALAVTQVKRDWPTATGPDRYRRGMYTFFFRSAPHPALGLFDAPDATASCTRRIRSNSPLQALTLLNDEAVIEFARGLARRVVAEAGAGDAERLNYAFLLAAGRHPSPTERDRLATFLAAQREEYRADPGSASLLVVKEQVFDSSPGGVVVAEESINPREMPELASWTALARVLFNLDDFMTRE
ncbi:MAG: PSD1 domain-containing protein [Bryobacteraceae bacterium]|nr:PSD1 domain-containing protein [Bryobacteraceae bacterium]